MATTRQIDAIAELTSSFRLLLNNWILGVPNLIAVIAVGILAFLLLGAAILTGGGLAALGSHGGAISGGGIAGMLSALFGVFGILLLVGGLVGVIAGAATVLGADEVWKGQKLDLAGAVSGAFKYLISLIVAGLIIGIVFVLVGWTVIGGIAWAFLMMFAVPAIVLGGASGVSAISESWRITTKNAGPSAMAFVGICVVFIAGFIVNLILGIIPVIGHIAALLVQVLLSTYVAIVVTRFYHLLEGKGATTPVPTTMT